MQESLVGPIASRVAALRVRHLVIAAIAVAVGASALGLHLVLGDADAPIGARVFFCVAGLGVAGWQLSLASKIGRGLAALRAGRTITWIYAIQAYVNGAHVASGVMLGLESGERLELPLAPGGDASALIQALSALHPRATPGFDAAAEARFVADPRSLLR